LRVGVAGCGRWGTKAIREWATLANEGVITGVDVHDTNTAALKQAHKIQGVSRAHTDYDKMLREVDVVHVCVPNERHYSAAMDAIRVGRHVLVEKPLTTNVQDAQRLRRAAEESKVALAPGHVYRHDATVKYAKDQLAAAWLGKPLYAKAQWTAKHDPPTQWGPVWDLLPHPVDILNDVWGLWPQGWTGSRMGKQAKGAVFLLAQYAGGPSASFELSWLDAVRRRCIDFVHENGVASLDLAGQRFTTHDQNGLRQASPLPSNTLLAELRWFAAGCKDPARLRWATDAGVGCVRAVEAAAAVAP